ncbi:MAG TPA: hypothetical protein VL308_20615 [Gemmatimonadaceae bacterium]|jgi:hypothetical protein|nr:hypothetical protein [Gemmatimonadaceae bacterium]
MSIRTPFRVIAAACLAATVAFDAAQAQAPRFEVTVDPTARATPLTGRLVVVVSKNAQPEPRMIIAPQGPAVFAVDLDQLRAGQAAIVDAKTSLGYPMPLAQLPVGEYYAQAIVNVYEPIKRADGKTIWVHFNDGTQEVMQIAAGNIYSDVQKIQVGSGGTVKLRIDKVIAASPRPQNTDWVKYVRIQSPKLTAFWGRPVYVHATVLLPKGYNQHPNVKYPTVYTFGHNVPFGFTPDSTHVRGLGQISPVTGLESGYDFYKSWIADGFPRFIAVSFEQATPFFLDSYSVNSASNGPYGDAMEQEIIPELEKQFRMIGKPYARLAEGASTGGWQTLALQLKHPDFFGGAWVLQPDPIDFRRYQLVDIYSDTNAFVLPNTQLTTTERPFRRTVEGQVAWTLRQLSLFEEVLGTRGRSNYQLEGWEAVYGPIDADGYPKPLWNKLTGTIDRSVANAMRDNGYDLRDYAQQNWDTLGPKVAGKLHFFAGDMDDFYLNLAVYRFDDFLKGTDLGKSVPFTYGRPMKGHAWHVMPWAELVRQMAAHVKKNSPSGDDATAWWY